MKCQIPFLGENKKISSIMNLSSAELAQRVVLVNKNKLHVHVLAQVFRTALEYSI